MTPGPSSLEGEAVSGFLEIPVVEIILDKNVKIKT